MHHKKFLASFSLLSILLTSFAYAQPSESANSCITNINDHVNMGQSLQLQSCGLEDKDVPAIINFLSQHPSIINLYIDNNKIQPAGGKQLAALKNLPFIEFNGNPVGDDTAIELAKKVNIIQYIHLNGCNITDVGAKALGADHHITYMDLSNNKITSTGVEALANDTDLQDLYIAANKFDAEGINAIVANNSIEVLDISSNNLGDAGAEILSHRKKSFGELHIDENNITDKGIIKIVDNFPGIYNFTARHNKIGIDGAKEIVTYMSYPMFVDLSYNNLGDQGVAILNKLSPAAPFSLYIDGNHVTDAGVKALSGRFWLFLSLAHNQITDEGAKTIAAMKVDCIYLDYNQIDDQGAEALAAARLDSLSLSHNQITDEGATALGKMSVTSLDLSGNQISDAGATALALSSSLTNLTLAHNTIHDDGASSLAKTTKITTLDVSHNLIGAAGLAALKANPVITTLDVDGNPGE